MRIILTLSSELFDDPNQELSIQPGVAVGDLITSAVNEFRLPQGEYAIYERDTNRRLEPAQTIEQHGLQTGAVLLFRREEPAQNIARVISVRQQGRIPFSYGPQMAFIREAETKTIFRLQWQPAVIGRPDSNNPESKKLLTVNLEAIPNGQSVSRNHAAITETDGTFYIEALAARNATFLNEQELTVGEKYTLHNEDRIRVGKITLIFHIPETQIIPPR